MTHRIFVVAALGLLLASAAARAQLASQTALVGTVTDASGSVIPGAVVVAIDLGTQDTYETATNAQGQYNIQFVRIGTYRITVTLEGFQTFVASNVEVATNQVVRTDAVLRVGELSETVDVTAAAILLATDSATIRQSIGQRAVEELPLSGRNVWTLAGTTPGVLGGTSSFVGAGQRSIQNSLSLDGINTAANLLTSTSMRPIVDAVTEVEVQTGSTSAEYGSYLGVHVNVVTKSGTNRFHGSQFWFFRDDALNARGFFEDRSKPANPLRYNQFGVEFDGPVVIPRLFDGRNKTFFMAAYEGVRNESQTSSLISLPTERMRRGDFSEYKGTIRNPYTLVPYPGNIIPAADLSPQGLRAVEYYPLPNLPGIGANHLATTGSDANTDQWLARVDQTIGNKVRLYARYNWQDELNSSTASIPVNSRTAPRNNQNILVAYTHTLTSALLNDFRIGYHRVNADDINYFSYSDLGRAGADLGIPGFDGDLRYGNPGIPSFFVTGSPELGAGGTNWFQDDTTFQLANVLAYSRGSHNIRTGVDLRRLGTGREAANEPRGSFTFNGQMSGHAFADLMLGVPQRVNTPVEQLPGRVAGWRNGFFVNDNWQVRRNVTLSLGLRYELNLPVYTTTGWASMLNEDQTELIPANPPQKGFEFYEARYTDFAPRVGATYRLNDKTVLRAGFGIYYNPNQMNTFTFLTNNPPLSPLYLFTNQTGNPVYTLDHPTGTASATSQPTVTTPTRELPTAHKSQWSFDVQRELWTGTAVELQYVGSNTSNLDRSFYNNTPEPGPGAVNPRRPNQLWGVLRTIKNDLSADYDAVSVVLRRRMRQGLQLTAHYTWSHTYDMATHSNSSAGRGGNPYDPQADYAPADWDVPHRFVASYMYELPFFATSPRWILKNLVGGWQVSGITTFESGRPVNVTISGDRANTSTTNQRPDLVGTPSANCSTSNLTNCIDASAFALPALYTWGTAPRNPVRGPGQSWTDLAILKSVSLGIGGAQMQFRGEFFNVFNQVRLNNPAAVFDSSTFGRITSAQSMREAQVGVRILF
jgi:hypothetical protein